MKELVEKNKILQITVGSRLYGTHNINSDLDMSGIFIAPRSYYLGLSNVEQVDHSIVSKHANGKNDSDAIDFTMYELRKFVKLALDNNPNIIEQLFCPKDKVIFENILGRKLLDHAYLFPWKGASKKFLGYAYGQRHKMVIKTDNYTNLNSFNDWLNYHLANPRTEEKMKHEFYSNQLLAELRDIKITGVKFHEHHALVGDINISLTDKLSKVHAKVKDRLSKVGNREELYTKYGYDVKFGQNLVRLMFEGKELLTTGKLEYPLKERQMLLDIRNGLWKREDIIAYSEQLEAEIETLEDTSDLPSKPRYDEIEKLLIDMVEEHWASVGKHPFFDHKNQVKVFQENNK